MRLDPNHSQLETQARSLGVELLQFAQKLQSNTLKKDDIQTAFDNWVKKGGKITGASFDDSGDQICMFGSIT